VRRGRGSRLIKKRKKKTFSFSLDPLKRKEAPGNRVQSGPKKKEKEGKYSRVKIPREAAREPSQLRRCSICATSQDGPSEEEKREKKNPSPNCPALLCSHLGERREEREGEDDESEELHCC